MISSIISSILSVARVHAQDKVHDTIEYDCDVAPRFFDGHPLFLEPVSRKCSGGCTQVRFTKTNKEITLTPSLLEDFLGIFVFLEENGRFYDHATKENFAMQRDHLVAARPWRLTRDLYGTGLPKCQEGTKGLFHFSGMSRCENDFLDSFFRGMSPKKLLGHPVFWTAEKRKCFILDVADSRDFLRQKKSRKDFHHNWMDSMTRCGLGIAVEHQVEYFNKTKVSFPYNGHSFIDLIIFSSNIIRHFIVLRHKRGLPLGTSSDVLRILEREYDLVFAAWSTIDLRANTSLEVYAL